MKTCLVVAASVAASVAGISDDVLFEDGLSLLQVRAQPIKEAQEPKYFEGPAGTDCAPGQDITFAMCLEAQVLKLIPNTIAPWGLMYNQRSGAYMQRGCFILGGNMYFSDEPVAGRLGRGSARIRPICSTQGGFDEFVEMAGISCREDDCQHKPANVHTLNWGGGVVVPELQILGPGAICEPCGILSMAQCAKAGDTGLIEALYGSAITSEFSHSCAGGGHSRPASPSGCSVSFRAGGSSANFCPYDTPDGELAGLVSDSGAGVGFGRIRPVCGVCTTTTTTPEPPPAPIGAAMGMGNMGMGNMGMGMGNMGMGMGMGMGMMGMGMGDDSDEAAAIADPHMRTTSGKKFDLVD